MTPFRTVVPLAMEVNKAFSGYYRFGRTATM
jgi:hypothetical protein